MFHVEEELKKLPKKPGVYLMHDQADTIIYVGKAINLHNRVRSYFREKVGRGPWIDKMISQIARFEYIVTDSELEALVLENNLINRGESIIIGNKVWVGKNTTFMKNTQVGNNCIVAQNSTVTKKFNQDNCIMGGVPAKIIKENIKWDKARPEKYIK